MCGKSRAQLISNSNLFVAREHIRQIYESLNLLSPPSPYVNRQMAHAICELCTLSFLAKSHDQNWTIFIWYFEYHYFWTFLTASSSVLCYLFSHLFFPSPISLHTHNKQRRLQRTFQLDLNELQSSAQKSSIRWKFEYEKVFRFDSLTEQRRQRDLCALLSWHCCSVYA